MYEYSYVEATAQGAFRMANYQELITENAKRGWRFVSAIPFRQNSYGNIKSFTLVFEKEM